MKQDIISIWKGHSRLRHFIYQDEYIKNNFKLIRVMILKVYSKKNGMMRIEKSLIFHISIFTKSLNS